MFVTLLPITMLSIASDFAFLPKTTESPVVPTPATALTSVPPTIFPSLFNTTLVSAIALVLAPAKTTVPMITVNVLRLSV